MIKRYKDNEIKELVQILNSNGIISVPTDTVFGICAKMNSKIAREGPISIKQIKY